LPWLNDGGRGGRSGDGGEYEGLHGFFLVKYAWMARSATGEDVFTQSTYYSNRLNHILFGWLPGKLWEKQGRFAMRTYYSPGGDHTRFGYVGDTQPYQSAAALCDRFRDSPVAQGVRWLAGEWPTAWMQYCLKWAVLGDFDQVPARQPDALAYRDEGFQTVYMRSDWSDEATWILFENGPYVSVHQSLDKGGFEIFKGDWLAASTGNLDHANVGASHTMNYLHRTISANALLIEDPQEKWKGFLGGATGGPDGGGERTNYPLSSSPDVDSYLNYRPIFQRGHLDRFADTKEYTYASADLTDAYNSPQFHGGTLNRAKVESVNRELLYLREVDSLVVMDRVTSTEAGFKKTFLLHSLGDLDVTGGTETKLSEGEFQYAGANQAIIRYGWPKPKPTFARCLSVTLLPEKASLMKIGGREDLPPGKTEGVAGDQWHGQHRHHHIKDFWVQGTNYPPGNPPETRWFGDPATPDYVPGTPDETGGRGKWRLEVTPSEPSKTTVFFHVLCPRLGKEDSFPEVKRVAAEGYDGALIHENKQAAAVFFAQPGQVARALAFPLPVEQTWNLVVVGLAPGDYALKLPGQVAIAVAKVAADGVASFPGVSGEVRLEVVK
jgi:hypothetical protein